MPSNPSRSPSLVPSESPVSSAPSHLPSSAAPTLTDSPVNVPTRHPFLTKVPNTYDHRYDDQFLHDDLTADQRRGIIGAIIIGSICTLGIGYMCLRCCSEAVKEKLNDCFGRRVQPVPTDAEGVDHVELASVRPVCNEDGLDHDVRLPEATIVE